MHENLNIKICKCIIQIYSTNNLYKYKRTMFVCTDKNR